MRFLTYYFFILANLIIANDKGMDLFNNGNYKEAAEYYSSILKERGEDNAASFNLGASQYYMEDNVSALKRFEQALGSKDRMLQSKALYNMARILQDQNELDKSLSLYKKSLELNPNDIDSKINYELLKKMINQQNSQDQENDQNQEGSEEQQNDQNQEGSEEQQNDQNHQKSSKTIKIKRDQKSSKTIKIKRDQKSSKTIKIKRGQKSSKTIKIKRDQKSSKTIKIKRGQKSRNKILVIAKQKTF